MLEQLKDALLFGFSLEEIDSDRNVLPAKAVQQNHPDQRNEGDKVTGDDGGGGGDSYISEIPVAAHVR